MVSNEVGSNPFAIPQVGWSRLGRGFEFCDRELNNALFFQDYFSEKPTSCTVKFRRRFQITRELFWILQILFFYMTYGLSKKRCIRKIGIVCIAKVYGYHSCPWHMACQFMHAMSIVGWMIYHF